MKLKSKSQWFMVNVAHVNAGNKVSSLGKLLDWKMRLKIGLDAAQGNIQQQTCLNMVEGYRKGGLGGCL